MTPVFCFSIFFFKTQKKSRTLRIQSPSLVNIAHRHTEQHDFSFYIHFHIHSQWPRLKNSFLELHLGLTSDLIHSSMSRLSPLPLSLSTHPLLLLPAFQTPRPQLTPETFFLFKSLLHRPPSSPHHFSFLTVKISPLSLYGFLRPENRSNLNLAIMTTMKHLLWKVEFIMQELAALETSLSAFILWIHLLRSPLTHLPKPEKARIRWLLHLQGWGWGQLEVPGWGSA